MTGHNSQINFRDSLETNKSLQLVCFVFPIEVPGEIDPLSVHKLEPLRGTYRGPVGHGIA